MDHDLDVMLESLTQAQAPSRAGSSSRATINGVGVGGIGGTAMRMVSGTGTAQEMVNRLENQRRDEIARTSPRMSIQWNSDGPWEPWDGSMYSRPRVQAGPRQIRRMCQECGMIIEEGQMHSHDSPLTAQEVRLNENSRRINEYMTVPDTFAYSYDASFCEAMKKEIVEQLVDVPVGTAWKKSRVY